MRVWNCLIQVENMDTYMDYGRLIVKCFFSGGPK